MGSMKPLLIQLPGMLTPMPSLELKHSIDYWHKLGAALIAAAQHSP